MVECIRKRCSAGCGFLVWEIFSECAGSKKGGAADCKVRPEGRSMFRKRWGKLTKKGRENDIQGVNA